MWLRLCRPAGEVRVTSDGQRSSSSSGGKQQRRLAAPAASSYQGRLPAVRLQVDRKAAVAGDQRVDDPHSTPLGGCKQRRLACS